MYGKIHGVNKARNITLHYLPGGCSPLGNLSEFDSLKFPFLDGFLSHSDRMISARFQLAELGNFP